MATDFWTRLDLAIKAAAASREARIAELQALEIDPDSFVHEGMVWLNRWSRLVGVCTPFRRQGRAEALNFNEVSSSLQHFRHSTGAHSEAVNRLERAAHRALAGLMSCVHRVSTFSSLLAGCWRACIKIDESRLRRRVLRRARAGRPMIGFASINRTFCPLTHPASHRSRIPRAPG